MVVTTSVLYPVQVLIYIKTKSRMAAQIRIESNALFTLSLFSSFLFAV
jgi:hypothetical protein